ncbi:Meiotic recombination protein REC8-like [Acipenser ruthenus]|uniref:Meiotic recombination protein REC8-like n=1 Tax=Acipenser ruthenus TaxID=7906 RepID=A0A444ULX7_ACIRT|nr:Meiotic recombination protein REC8-like [Acipenser ruthenus]
MTYFMESRITMQDLIPSEALLEMSDEERSRSFVTLESRWSPVEPAQPEVEAERPILEGIPEEIGVPEEREELEEPRGEEAVTAESVLRLAAEQIEPFGETYFDILAPHGILRKVAAVLFFRVLELCERRVLSAFQSEPYARILIRPGALYGVQ